MEENKEPIGLVEPTKIEAWKRQYRKVYAIEVEDGDEVHVGFFKRPTIEVMAAVTKIAKTDEVKSGTTLFDGCWLGGSEQLRTDSVLFIAAMTQLNKLMEGTTSRLKNL